MEHEYNHVICQIPFIINYSTEINLLKDKIIKSLMHYCDQSTNIETYGRNILIIDNYKKSQ